MAAVYAPYILEVLGKHDGLNELARIMPVLQPAARPTVAMELLRYGDQRGLHDTLALLQDESAETWQRANAAPARNMRRPLRACRLGKHSQIRGRTTICILLRAKCSHAFAVTPSKRRDS